MNFKHAYTLIVAAFAWVMLSVAASAVPITPGSTNPLANLSEYEDGAFFGAGSVAINRVYTFSPVSVTNPVQFTFSSSTSGNAIFSSLVAVWRDLTTNTVIGTFTSSNTAINILSLIPGNSYSLTITGNYTRPRAPGSGSFDFSVSAVPIPPAAILLVSGLLGMGFLGRSKRGATSVKV
jgi:hypothetical protein